MKLELAVALASLGRGLAQQSAWAQCGGTGWTGQTTCASGYTCSVLNSHYSQCIPSVGTASSTTRLVTPSSSTSTTKPVTSPSSTNTGGPSSSTGFAHTSGTAFNVDGHTGYFAGTNAYWIGFLTNDADVDLVMSHLQQSGIKLLRVWGFNDVSSAPSSGTVWYQSFVSGQSPQINTGSNGLKRLDYVVQSAAAHDIKLIINFVNNWTDYGGIAAYVKFYGLANDQAWYTSSAAQSQYQTYIKAVVSRYSNSTAIFAWELMNESRCKGCPTSTVYNWAKTTSAYIKSLDPNHMVTLGDEGFNPSSGDGSYPYTTAEGVSFSQNLGISSLDFGTFHMYPDSWGVASTNWPLAWIKSHGATCVTAGKPCLLEEYGTSTNHVSVESPWQQAALAAAGVAGDMFWQDGDNLSTGQTSNDGNTIYYNTAEWTSLVVDHVAAIKSSNKS